MRLRSLLLPLVLMLALPATAAQRKPAAVSKSWHFAVAGDSRNCGDVVMPILARGIKADNARFYWHLGDFRAIYKMDEDMVQAAKMQGKTLTKDDYFKEAWPDNIEHQLLPFKPLPVYSAIGNHETYAP
ncbi:MAG: hypothetical protein JWN02_684, partial [Acidobacteria bacterium]|nr:hypothetical protein [Acidobacteriota bacterium]